MKWLVWHAGELCDGDFPSSGRVVHWQYLHERYSAEHLTLCDGSGSVQLCPPFLNEHTVICRQLSQAFQIRKDGA